MPWILPITCTNLSQMRDKSIRQIRLAEQASMDMLSDKYCRKQIHTQWHSGMMGDSVITQATNTQPYNLATHDNKLHVHKPLHAMELAHTHMNSMSRHTLRSTAQTTPRASKPESWPVKACVTTCNKHETTYRWWLHPAVVIWIHIQSNNLAKRGNEIQTVNPN